AGFSATVGKADGQAMMAGVPTVQMQLQDAEDFVSLGGTLAWDLSQYGDSDLARLQQANLLKQWFTAGTLLSMLGLDMYTVGSGESSVSGMMMFYEHGPLSIVAGSVRDAQGGVLGAGSADCRWQQRSLGLDG